VRSRDISAIAPAKAGLLLSSKCGWDVWEPDEIGNNISFHPFNEYRCLSMMNLIVLQSEFKAGP